MDEGKQLPKGRRTALWVHTAPTRAEAESLRVAVCVVPREGALKGRYVLNRGFGGWERENVDTVPGVTAAFAELAKERRVRRANLQG